MRRTQGGGTMRVRLVPRTCYEERSMSVEEENKALSRRIGGP
jgi:hypothetical protein